MSQEIKCPKHGMRDYHGDVVCANCNKKYSGKEFRAMNPGDNCYRCGKQLVPAIKQGLDNMAMARAICPECFDEPDVETKPSKTLSLETDKLHSRTIAKMISGFFGSLLLFCEPEDLYDVIVHLSAYKDGYLKKWKELKKLLQNS